MSATTSQKLIGTAATAIVAIGLLAAPTANAYPPAPLTPACLGWKLNSTVLTVRQSNGPEVWVDWWNGTSSTGTGVSDHVYFDAASKVHRVAESGQAQGGVTGSHIDFTIKWNNGVTGHYTGDIDSDTGRVLGGRTVPSKGETAAWEAEERFECVRREAEPPPPAPAPPPPPPAQQPPPPPVEQPKLGPTVTFDTVLGGLVAHITDRSGVTSQCTYQTDLVTRNFTLNANSTFDLRIVPAIPGFRNWDVSVSCDNGTSTQTSTFF